MKNLTETLADLGCTHCKGKDVQRQDIYRADGSLVGSYTAHEAWEALKDDKAQFEMTE